MTYKVRELNFWERCNLIHIVASFQQNEVIAAVDVLAHTLEIENEPLEEYTVAGHKIKKLSDEQIERVLASMTSEDIARYITQALEVNKIPFQIQGGGTT